MVAAAIYCRISKDEEGDTLGVQRQERLCRRLCEERGWDVAQVFVDNDISASTGRVRPSYEALVRAIEAGTVEALAVFDFDRLHRRPIELERFFEVTDKRGILFGTVGGQVNLADPDDRFKARIMGAVARAETEKMQKRIRAKHAELAEQGRPVGLGASKPFGYKQGGMEINETEAALLRQAALDVLNGVPVTSIARRWNAAGVRTPFPRSKQSTWRAQSVKALLVSPRPAGLRRHRVTGTDRTVEFPAAWPAILDQATHQRLVTRLSRPPAAPHGRGMLSGLVVCGCGNRMSRDSKEGIPTYRCRKGPGLTGCGNGLNAATVEGAVLADIAQYLDTEVAALEGVEADSEDEAVRLNAEIEEAERLKLRLAEQLISGGDFDDAELAVMRRANKARIESLQHRLAQITAHTVVRRWKSSEQFRAEWLSTDDVAVRRALLGSFITQVEILPYAGRRRDAGRVRIDYVH